jgi:excisionase family DNA binding protein
MPPSDQTKLLLDYREAAAALGVCVRTVTKMRKKGEIKHVRIGVRVLFPVADLRRWIDEHKEGGEV